MATYILVPGAWLGAWAWRDVAAGLRGRGHEVYALSLTGLGERSHLAGPEVGLDTHIADIVNLVESEDLREVILVAHSYSGAPVTGAADRLGERLSRVVWVDSAPFADGMGMTAFVSPEELCDDPVSIPFPGGANLAAGDSGRGLTAEHVALLDARAKPHPRKSYTDALSLTGGQTARNVLIAADDTRGMVAAGLPILSFFGEDFDRFDLDTGHWPMLSAPGELAEVLSKVASGD
ncbi:hypothetical protein Afil01_34990 [Actinorhabdospora filicis]|uniref:AB hydrolase-1 domain-containing protein n=1 Tax=Actinorhabdospora filicis TaxID=1785913 RepID=A0A9W6SMV6_9ACTN|nr:alpha/beta fold hydrolase [Actinorhabdospora filicis]GLZ78692.1 hypothetical protein Afil01_34990 [Actinorhabdospora filicis]